MLVIVFVILTAGPSRGDLVNFVVSEEQEGDGLPDMCTPSVVDEALTTVGFEVLETRDMALDANPGGIPWYQPLTPSWNVFTQRFQFNWFGMRLTKAIIYVMEMVSQPQTTISVSSLISASGLDTIV